MGITPTPGHVKEHRDHLVAAIQSVWDDLGIKRTSDWKAAGGFVVVGVETAEAENMPMWSDAQLGLQPSESQDLEAAVEREFAAASMVRMQTAIPASARVQPTAAMGASPIGVAT